MFPLLMYRGWSPGIAKHSALVSPPFFLTSGSLPHPDASSILYQKSSSLVVRVSVFYSFVLEYE